MSKRDYYEVLGINKSSTEAEIKSAYRSLARKHHPDIDKTAGADERFKEISEAYQVLSDPQKKKNYDQFGHAAFEQGGGGGAGYNPFGGGFGQGGRTYSYSTGGGNADFDFSGFEDPFSLFETIFGGMGGQGFGGFRQRPTYQLQLTFEEAVHGVKKDIEVEKQEGQTRKKDQMSINIPAGVDDGTKMRFGEIDIVFRVRSNPNYLRQGNNLVTDATLAIPQLVLGDTIEVKTIDGQVKIKVPAGTEPGSLVRIKGKGVPNMRGGGRGDHFVRVKVGMPKGVSGEEKRLYEQLADLAKKKKSWF